MPTGAVKLSAMLVGQELAAARDCQLDQRSSKWRQKYHSEYRYRIRSVFIAAKEERQVSNPANRASKCCGNCRDEHVAIFDMSQFVT